MRLIETYSTGEYSENEVFQCQNCKRTYTVEAGGDVSACWCEFEGEQ